MEVDTEDEIKLNFLKRLKILRFNHIVTSGEGGDDQIDFFFFLNLMTK